MKKGMGLKAQIEEQNLPIYDNSFTIEELTRFVEEMIGKAANEKSNNNRKQCSKNRS
jgi:hypothetical protein